MFDEQIDFFAKIMYMNQLKISGDIFISCNDGKVHLLTPPNIDYYLDKNEKYN